MSDATWNELEELLAPIHDDVQLYARRIARSSAEGDDIFQEAVLRAARKLASLRERAKFRAWMFSVVSSVHRTRARRSSWRRWIPWEATHEPVGDDGSLWVDRRASAGRAAAALATLSPPQREAIVLFELHGYSIEEVAELQNASVTSIKSRLQRGRERLRTYYRAASEPVLPSTTDTQEVCRG